jgi:hypothetical protein
MTLSFSNLFAGIFVVAALNACSASVDSSSSASATAQAQSSASSLALPMQFNIELHTDAKDEDIVTFIMALKNRGFAVEHVMTTTSKTPGEKHVITAKQTRLLPKEVVDAMTEDLKKMAPPGKFSQTRSVSQSK